MTLKVYAYKNCGTCRKALKFLDGHGIEYEAVAIREKPPTKGELKRMLEEVDGNVRRLFNSSGGDYRALDLKNKLAVMKDSEAIDLLAGNGNLVKRPFVPLEEGGLVGYKEEEWAKALL